jgi:hypothetical protein
MFDEMSEKTSKHTAFHIYICLMNCRCWDLPITKIEEGIKKYIFK